MKVGDFLDGESRFSLPSSSSSSTTTQLSSFRSFSSSLIEKSVRVWLELGPAMRDDEISPRMVRR